MKKADKIILIGCFSSAGFFGLMWFLPLFVTLTPTFTDEELHQYDMFNSSIIVIKPLLTAHAYRDGSFYDYYNGKCSYNCLYTKINQTIPYRYTSSYNMIQVFTILNAKMITDYDLHYNPEILQHYKTVVLLHNEYVTQEIFDAIQNHTQVLYLYPNALYGKVNISDTGIMSLVQGHNYNNKTNGFDWKYDNTIPYETDNECAKPLWIPVSNGYQLNCYPEYTMMKHKEIFWFIKELSK